MRASFSRSPPGCGSTRRCRNTRCLTRTARWPTSAKAASKAPRYSFPDLQSALLKESLQMSTLTTRREFLAGVAATAVVSRVRRFEGASSKPVRGAFMILNTPFTVTGAVDWEDLDREAVFVDRCGCQGVVWPQGSSRVATLTKDERMRGMD